MYFSVAYKVSFTRNYRLLLYYFDAKKVFKRVIFYTKLNFWSEQLIKIFRIFHTTVVVNNIALEQ